MTAWTQLTQHSTLPSGTAWQHLNAQLASGGTIVNDGITVDIEFSSVDAEIADDAILAEINDTGIVVELDEGIEVEVME